MPSCKITKIHTFFVGIKGNIFHKNHRFSLFQSFHAISFAYTMSWSSYSHSTTHRLLLLTHLSPTTSSRFTPHQDQAIYKFNIFSSVSSFLLPSPPVSRCVILYLISVTVRPQTCRIYKSSLPLIFMLFYFSLSQ